LKKVQLFTEKVELFHIDGSTNACAVVRSRQMWHEIVTGRQIMQCYNQSSTNQSIFQSVNQTIL